MKTYFLFGIFILSTTFCIAQKPPMKFGKIDIENLKMTHYANDSSVSAIMLKDYGKAELIYDQIIGWQLHFKHHRRIKIFKKDGYKWADGSITLYHDLDQSEEIRGLKANTYNLKNGKAVITKLDKKSLFSERIDKNRDAKKFTLNNVMEGSIIEYSYTVVSDFYYNSFNSWQFQYSIPVLWSEYRTFIPEYYTYQKLFQGYLPFLINTTDKTEKTTKTKHVESSLMSNSASAIREGRISNVTYGEVKYIENSNRWVVENAPAFESEPYITTSKNYVSKVKFQLTTTHFSSNPYKNVMQTWGKMNTRYLEAEYFGRKVEGSGFLNAEVDAILANTTDDNSKVSAIYSFVKNNVGWSGQNRSTVDNSLKRAFDDKKGSSAEVNLILTSMLQKAGIDASPVLLSTRANGRIRKDVPNSSLFNYVICKVTLADGYILLDATDPYLPIDLLPKRCLNGEGWVVSENNSGWVKLATNKKSTTQVS
jgi:hypothetical protein